MINIIEGSYLLAFVASLYVNPVSCDGISQRGLARYFKQSMTKTVVSVQIVSVLDFPDTEIPFWQVSKDNETTFFTEIYNLQVCDYT